MIKEIFEINDMFAVMAEIDKLRQEADEQMGKLNLDEEITEPTEILKKLRSTISVMQRLERKMSNVMGLVKERL